MASLVDMLTQQLGGNTLKQISGLLGADENKTSSAMAAALPTLLGALNRNTSQGDGASSLLNALNKDHDGSILDNLGGFLGNADSGPGAGILRHALGDKQQRVEQGISKSTGLDMGSVGKLLGMMAPVVMGALGKVQREKKMDANALSGFLDQEEKEVRQRAPKEMGLIGALLDSDGDGDFDMGDIAKKGMGLLGKMLGGK